MQTVLFTVSYIIITVSGTQFDTSSITPLHWLAVIMALVTAALHFILGLEMLPHWMGILFVLSTGGFVGAVLLFFANVRRRLLYLIGIPYTGSQIIFWLLVDPGSTDLILEAIDKTAQVVLVVALVMLYRREA